MEGALAIVLVVAGLLSSMKVSWFLQQYMNQLLGPVLIVAGLFLLEVFRVSLPGMGRAGEKLQQRFAAKGAVGALPLGALFALSFCPVSAALFFGSLMPLAVQFDSPVILPIVYGVGTALPVVVFAVLIASGARAVGKLFDRLKQIEWWARKLTGLVFLGVGVYMTLWYTVGILG